MGTPRSTQRALLLVLTVTGAFLACIGVSNGTLSASQISHSATHLPPAPNPYPTTVGETWNYAYSLGEHATPGGASSVTGTILTTLTGSTTFNGNPVLDYNSVFNYSSASNGGTTGTLTTDEYDNFVPNGAQTYFDYYGHNQSGNESDENGSVLITSSNTQTYTGSPFILDILPEKNTNVATEPGAYSLTASQATTVQGNPYSSVSVTYNRNNDGSYTE